MKFNMCPHLTVGDEDHFHGTTIILQPFHSAEVLGRLQAIEDRDNVGDDYSCMAPGFCDHVLLRPLDYISQRKDTRVGLELKGRFYTKTSVLEDRRSNGRRRIGFEEMGVNSARTKRRDL